MKRSSLPGKKRVTVSDLSNESFKTEKPQVPSKSPNSVWDDLRRELDSVGKNCQQQQQRSLSLGSSVSSVLALKKSSSMKRCKSWGENRRTSSTAARSFVMWLPTNLESDDDDFDDDDDLSHDCPTDRCNGLLDTVQPRQVDTAPRVA
jgi:hypothetical protein